MMTYDLWQRNWKRKEEVIREDVVDHWYKVRTIELPY